MVRLATLGGAAAGRLQASLYHARKREKQRRAVRAFTSLLDGNPAVEFALPAAIDLYASSSAPLTTDDDYVVSINGVNRAPPDIAANTIFHVGHFPQGTLVQAFANVTLYIDAGLGRYVAIGSNA